LRRLNLRPACDDQVHAGDSGVGGLFVKSIRPDTHDPIPVAPARAHDMARIIGRFVALLAIAVVLMVFAWSR
jgi:hypothetical protein